jgi:DNA-binding transcriptional ArsR family regulator
LQDASGLAYETLRRALKALKLAGIINQELLGKTRYDGYAYVLNTERLKELGAPHVDSFFKGYKNV